MKQNASQFLQWMKMENQREGKTTEKKEETNSDCLQSDRNRPLTHPPSVKDISTIICLSIGKCASPGDQPHCSTICVITLICFDSSGSLNIKLHWIANENSWGTRLDQHFRLSPLDDTYSNSTAFMHSKWHSFFTCPPTHSLWVTLMYCDNTCANAPLHIKPQKNRIVKQ